MSSSIMILRNAETWVNKIKRNMSCAWAMQLWVNGSGRGGWAKRISGDAQVMWMNAINFQAQTTVLCPSISCTTLQLQHVRQCSCSFGVAILLIPQVNKMFAHQLPELQNGCVHSGVADVLLWMHKAAGLADTFTDNRVSHIVWYASPESNMEHTFTAKNHASSARKKTAWQVPSAALPYRPGLATRPRIRYGAVLPADLFLQWGHRLFRFLAGQPGQQ